MANGDSSVSFSPLLRSREAASSPAPSSINPGHGFRALADKLSSSPFDDSESRLMSVGIEMEALQAIYGEDACRLHAPSRPSSFQGPPSSPAPPQLASAGAGSSNAGYPGARGSLLKGVVVPQAVSMMRGESGGSRTSEEDQDLSSEVSDYRSGERIRYELGMPLFQDQDDDWLAAVRESKSVKGSNVPMIRILVSLPPSYPEATGPQLQLLGRYLGQYNIDPAFFGEVTRTFISQNGVKFTPGDVCVFEGVEYVLGVARKWYLARLREGKDGEMAREMDRLRGLSGRALSGDLVDDGDLGPAQLLTPTRNNHEGPSKVDLETRENLDEYKAHLESTGRPLPLESPMISDGLPAHIKIYSSQAITASRSVFIGHACRVTDPLEVPAVIHQLLSDKKIAKATHPVMHAYRIVKPSRAGTGTLLLSDNDDDGESAAGGRLAHLLQILELENVLVVVSRWYGGILLGSERFKLINQAARDALDGAGFLSGKSGVESEGKPRQARR